MNYTIRHSAKFAMHLTTHFSKHTKGSFISSSADSELVQNSEFSDRQSTTHKTSLHKETQQCAFF